MLQRDEAVKFLGRMVVCSAKNHDKEKMYLCIDVDCSREGIKIMAPEEFKGHWVHYSTLKIINHE